MAASLGFLAGTGKTSLQAADPAHSAKSEKYLYIWRGMNGEFIPIF